jgi:glucose-6-phosphate isomerase
MKLKSKDIKLGKIAAKVGKTIAKFEKKQIIKRIWEKDPSVWKKEESYSPLIKDRLGWLSLPYTMTNNVYEINEFTKEVIAEGFTDAVLLGMGGSSMGPEVLCNVFGTAQGYLKLHVLDTTDPKSVRSISDAIDVKKTLFIVASKSGSTIEVDSMFRFFFEKVKESVSEEPGRNFISITDSNTVLQEVSRQNGFRKVFTNPSDIGGRYSVLSYFGLVPAALIGIDLIEFLRNAGSMMNMCSDLDATRNPAAFIGIVAGIAASEGRDKLTFTYSDNLKTFGYWVEQLIAESTGKEKKGILPVEGEVLGKAGEYGKDRMFVSTMFNASVDLKKSAAALEKKGHPAINILLTDKYDIAGQFYLWEFATAVMGVLLGINPFDEPNVKESKDNTMRVLSEFEEKGSLPKEEPLVSDGKLGISMSIGEGQLRIKGARNLLINDIVEAFLMLKEKGDYIALMAYIDGSRKNKKRLDKIRELLKSETKCAVTVGFGPRFLHSTGQYHKGGPNNGLFIQFVIDDKDDVAIPGKSYSFGNLKNAQAIGDYESLLKWKRRVLRVNLGDDAEKGLEKFYEYLKKAI